MDVGQSVISLQIMPGLFDPLTIRDLTFANRVFVSPICQ
jgi:2,4-dienoyl-CoA reductase-like NADH-dependent reductase (Old Yellow Enzyme family)